MKTKIASSAALCLLLLGCSSETATPIGPLDASASSDASGTKDASSTNDAAATPTDSGTVADSGSATCTPIANNAPMITETIMSNVMAPVGTGGAIADGTYIITAKVQYKGGGTTAKGQTFTMKITGDQVDLTGSSSPDPQQSVRFTMTADAATGALKWVGNCPAAFVGKDFGVTSYTASGATLHIYKPTNDVVFTKQ